MAAAALSAASGSLACECAAGVNSAAFLARARVAFVGKIVSAKLSMRPTPPDRFSPEGDFDPREVVTFQVIDPIRGVHTGQLVTFDHAVRAGSCDMSVDPAPNEIVNHFEAAVWSARSASDVDWNTWLIVDRLSLCSISRPLGVDEAQGAKSREVRRLKRLLRTSQ